MAKPSSIGGKSIIVRLEMDPRKVNFGPVAASITEADGDIVAIDVISNEPEKTVRDLTVMVQRNGQIDQISNQLSNIDGVRVLHISDRTFLLHLGGKIETNPKTPINNRDDLSRVYTPEVSRVCMAIHDEASKAYSLTIKRNTVAVVSDGSAVLGLGNIGPAAAMPVMEGKAMLFKQFAGVDAFPLCLDTQDTEEIIRTVKAIAPGFGGINLEDISSPRCFEIEARLKKELDIPVFHDDQHGTAVVLLAGLISALKVVGKEMNQIKVVICGIGAAGAACGKVLLHAGVKELIGVDKDGALSADRSYDQPSWSWFAQHSNPDRKQGGLSEVIQDADVFIGLSKGGILKRSDVESMNRDPIIFAMANPQPEIEPDQIEDIAGVIATGRSDYPNQINNVLCFPGIFRGALDCRAADINEPMKQAAAEAIASVVADSERNKHYIIPSVFNSNIVSSVREHVIRAAIHSGAARKIPREFR